jgi:hypothetical protein
MNERSTVQTLALAVGVVFLLTGILGFVPGITTHYGDMSFAGHDSEAKLLGLFQTSVLHNVVHILFGVAGFALARHEDTARQFLTIGGAVYLVLFVYGAVFHGDSGGNVVPVNWADNILHLALGIGMIAMGALGAQRRPRTAHA